ncbi:MAG: anti-sigma factor family protein [Bacillota bacterium]
MECLYLQNLLSAYLDGELLPEEKQRIRKHLFFCETCRKELETLQQTKSILSRLDVQESPIDFVSAIQDHINQGITAPWLFLKMRWFAVVSLTFLLWLAPSFQTLSFRENYATEEQIIVRMSEAGQLPSAVPGNRRGGDSEPVSVNTIPVNYP